MEKIIIEDEEIYLKKSKWFGWGVIKPYKIDGKINWKNLLIGGSWIKFGIMAVIVIIILGCIDEYTTALRIANECLSNTNFIIVP